MSTRRSDEDDTSDFDAPPLPPKTEESAEEGEPSRYRLEASLGAGGWGEVHKAWDSKIGRYVALKLLHDNLPGAASARERFFREARAAGGLTSEHIVTIYDSGRWEGKPFLTMPLLEGETLHDRLERKKRLPPAEVMRIALQAAKGLRAAHDGGVIHRDVKPSNIFLKGPERKVVLLDFGVAKSSAEDRQLTSTGQLMGTCQFMSPEQLRAGTLDHRSDLFSLGSVLYLAAVGKHPFPGETLFEIMEAIADKDPVPPHRRNRKIPRPLSDLIMWLLTKPLDGRPGSAGEIVDRLREIRRDIKAAREVPEEFEWEGEKRPRRVRTVDLGGGESLELVRIPKGTFLMGSPDSDRDAHDDEKPRHEVELTRDFYIGKYPVTKGQFARFVAETGYTTEAESDGKGGSGFDARAGRCNKAPKYTWRNPGFEQTDRDPVVNVSWNDARAFCEWAGQKSGLKIGLPTEAQWEYACRGGADTRYFTGDDVDSLEGHANIADAMAKAMFPHWTAAGFDSGSLFTTPAGRFLPNGFGLYDMAGNVWEWCDDWYGVIPNPREKRTDPSGPETGSFRVNRGGGWNSYPRLCRSAYRSRNSPSNRLNFLGFRVAATPG